MNLPGDTRTYRVRIHPARDGASLYLLNVADHKELDRLAGRASELEAANERLDRFAYVAAHDLQEPLRTIGSYAQLLNKTFKDQLGEDGTEFLGYIDAGVARMHVLLRDLLSYSRVDIKPPHFKDVDCAEIVNDVLQDLGAAVADSGASVRVASLPSVRGDDTQIAQVFRNLIGNALKFVGKAPPEIDIRAARDGRNGSEWIFEVKDNGIGIAQDDLERIFLLFKRLHREDEYPGTGLGLAITRKIVERHGGRIWVASTLGEGSSFFFALPAATGGG
jgi:light-regulated signal transduction histidine kinase (bacteriophytochrome)